MTSMHIEMTAGMLTAGLRLLEKIVDKRFFIPVLGMVEFSGGRLTATDLDRELSVSVAALAFEGAGLLPYWPLLRLAGAFGADDLVTLDIAEVGTCATITSRFGRYRLPTMDVADFPHIEMPETAERIAIDGAALKDALGFALRFSSREKTRYYLNGVCLFGRDVVGSDGHRLAMTRNVTGHDFARVILPTAAVKTLLAMPAVDALVLGENRFFAEASGMRLTAKLIDGTYPDVERLIPTDGAAASFCRMGMLAAVRRLLALCDGAYPQISVVHDGERIALASAGNGAGEGGEESIAGSGAPFATSYNGDYLAQVLKALPGDHVSFTQVDEAAPAIFRGSDGEGGTAGRFVVMMPIRDRAKKTLAAARGLLAENPRQVAA